MDLTAAHSGYVFAAYGLTFVVLGFTIWLHVRRARRTAARLAGLEARQAPRRRTTTTREDA